MRFVPFAISLIVSLFSTTTLADDNESLNEIYGLFIAENFDIAEIRQRHDPEIIHVGGKNSRLLVGDKHFIDDNLAPFAEMIAEGRGTYDGVYYIKRRVVGESLAHDVGYYYSKITFDGGEPMAELSKFSWVFEKSGGQWRVITNFHSPPAPLDILETIADEAVVTIGGDSSAP